jgi:glycine/D-amino acid oxidase-like deaminating enzyme
MKKECFWKDPNYAPSPALAGDERTQYLIVGGGIGGLFAAHFLIEQGAKDIVLIEKNTIGSGSTGHSAGMLVAEIETSSWRKFAHERGEEAAALYWHAQESALASVRDAVRAGNIQCEYDEEEFLFLAHTHESREAMREEQDIRARMGAGNKVLAGSEAQDEFGSTFFPVLEKLEVAASVNPLALAHGMAADLKQRGVRIYENTRLQELGEHRAKTDGGEITFDRAIVSLGTAENTEGIRDFLTSVCVTHPLSQEELDRIRLDDRDMFLDMERRSYHYGKITADKRLLIGYGDVLDQTHGAPILHEPHVHNIERFISHVFHFSPEIEYAWTGRYALMLDVVPLVSVSGNRTHIGGAGTQLATIAIASYAVARMLDHEHPLQALFEPK